MPCDHKFLNYLNLDRIDFEPTTLIVGTFSPAWPATNSAEWFYGNTHSNHFWDVLPQLYGDASLISATQAEWKRFCHDKQIALTDVISCIDDADPDNREHSKILASLSDKAFAHHFDDFTFVNIVQLLKRHTAIKNVYFTRGVTEAFWKHIWNPVMEYANHNGLHERRLMHPSSSAGYQHEAHNIEHPGNQIPLLEDYILSRWQQEWHF